MKTILSKIMSPDLRRIFRYLAGYKGLIAFAAIFMIGEASMSSLTATLLGKMTDLGFYQQESWVIYGAPAALIGVTVLFGFCSIMNSYLMAKVSQSILIELRTELFDKMMRWPAHQYLATPTGVICSKFVNEANIALSGATSSIIVLVRDIAQILALLSLLFWQNWKLTLVTFIVGPLIVFVLRTVAKRLKTVVKASQASIAAMLTRVQESYEAERVIKLHGSYAFEEKRFECVNNAIRSNALKTLKLQGLATPITQMITMFGIAFVVAAALYEAQQGILTFGEFVTFLSALLLLKAPLQHLTGLNGTFASISVAARSIFETLDAKVEVDEGSKTIERACGEIRFENVYLTYPGQNEPALKGINLTVHSGEHLALVGQSGSGKSSLVNVIPRFWDPTYGHILLDGIDIRKFTLESLRKQIAIVSQEVILFDDTIRKNITYGLSNVTEEALNDAIEAAALKGFIESLPDGLESRIGEGGSLLSGGQRQRISIARAFLKNAPILLLDEATSALDSENEAIIKASLGRLSQGRTTITVAHRFSTIENADRIVAMGHGEILEVGTPKELLEMNGIYAKLYKLQVVKKEAVEA